MALLYVDGVFPLVGVLSIKSMVNPRLHVRPCLKKSALWQNVWHVKEDPSFMLVIFVVVGTINWSAQCLQRINKCAVMGKHWKWWYYKYYFLWLLKQHYHCNLIMLLNWQFLGWYIICSVPRCRICTNAGCKRSSSGRV